MTPEDLPSLEEITAWLTQIGQDREWLARELGVSRGTINAWFSPAMSRPIPEPTHRLLAMLMRTTELGEPRFTHAENRLIEQAMDAANYRTFPEFARDAVLIRVEEIIKKEQIPTGPKLHSPTPDDIEEERRRRYTNRVAEGEN